MKKVISIVLFVLLPVISAYSLTSINILSPNGFGSFPLESDSILLNKTTGDKSSESIEADLLRSDIKIYPNPAIDYIKIEGLKGDERLRIFNITGQLMKTLVLTSKRVDISDLLPGVYLIEIQTSENNRIIRKIIKK